MYSLNLKDASLILKRYILAKLPVFLWGGPGIGKSSLIHQIGLEENRVVRDIRLSQIEFADLRGIPFVDKEANNVRWSIPSFLPTDSEDNSILFLDELNLAHPSIMSAAYQLILDRRIGDYVLPKNVSIIAAGNRGSESSHVNDIPLPLLNRFVHMNIEADFKTWSKYALDKIHPLIVAFLTKSPNHLNIKDYSKATLAYNTPRTWEYASKILNTYIEDLKDPKVFKKYQKEITILLQGAIGEESTVSFIEYVKTNFSKIDLDLNRIYNDPEYSITRELDAKDILYIGSNLELIDSIQSFTSNANIVNNSLNFVYKNSSIEIYLAYTRYLSYDRKLKLHSPEYSAFSSIMKDIRTNHHSDASSIIEALKDKNN